MQMSLPIKLEFYWEEINLFSIVSNIILKVFRMLIQKVFH